MSTYSQILYQVVFSTKYREQTLDAKNRNDLYKYISGILRNKRCHLYRIGEIEDHIHIIMSLHRAVAVILVKDIKLASSDHIKTNKLFPNFSEWQDGYGAFTYSIEAKNNLIEYVKNQVAHHAKKTSREEFIELLKEHEIEFDEKYLI